MEEIGATNPEYLPLRVLWRRSCAHARKTIPLAPIHSFTKQIVPSMYQQSMSWSRLVSINTSFPHESYKFLPAHKNILGARRFFFLLLCFIFIAHFFVGLREPRKFFFKLSFCAFTCLSNNSLIS